MTNPKNYVKYPKVLLTKSDDYTSKMTNLKVQEGLYQTKRAMSITQRSAIVLNVCFDYLKRWLS